MASKDALDRAMRMRGFERYDEVTRLLGVLATEDEHLRRMEIIEDLLALIAAVAFDASKQAAWSQVR